MRCLSEINYNTNALFTSLNYQVSCAMTKFDVSLADLLRDKTSITLKCVSVTDLVNYITVYVKDNSCF